MATKAKFDKARPVTVRVPRQVADIDAVHKIVCGTLGELGCPACLSGFTITFSDLPVLVADARTHDIRAV